MHNCPACSSELNFKPWEGDNPSYEIFPHCGIQFGCDDTVPEKRVLLYKLWNEAWIKNNNKFLSNQDTAFIHEKLKSIS